MIYDVIIIGGGPGGYSAALYCARAGLTTLVIEKLCAGGQMATTTQVDNYPGFDEGIDGAELSMRMEKGAQRFGAQSIYDTVTDIDFSAFPRVITTAAGQYQARAVILATGASPQKLGVPGEEVFAGKGVSYCATCDGMFFRGRTVAVVGGGNTAVSSALTLGKLCQKVYLIHRRDELRADAMLQKQMAEMETIEPVLCAKVEEIQGETLVGSIALSDTRDGHTFTLPVQGVFVTIGTTPNTELFSGKLTLTKDGYIDADETTQTSLPGVYAVGDVRKKPLKQIVTAAADGAVASKFVQEFVRFNP